MEYIKVSKAALKWDLSARRVRVLCQEGRSTAKSRMKLQKLLLEIDKKLVKLSMLDRAEDRGMYRRIPVRIMGSFHEPPQPYLVEPMMNELIVHHADRKSKMHLVEAVALFHLDFEGIHPFIDGNGRTERLLLNLDLMKNGYPAIDVKFTYSSIKAPTPSCKTGSTKRRQWAYVPQLMGFAAKGYDT